jgi:DNA-binding CsgD family transcriptional regulator
MISDYEKAGKPLPPLVELRPNSPPLEVTEAGELPPDPPPPPFDRGAILAGLQVGYASLTDDELRVAQLWLLGESLEDVCDLLGRDKKTMRRTWQDIRRKLRDALRGPISS